MQVLLSTAPDPTGATHWGQQTFSLHPAVDCAPGDAIEGNITVVRKKENHRLMEVRLLSRPYTCLVKAWLSSFYLELVFRTAD